MHHVEFVIVVLLLVVVALTAAAQALSLPYPILLVLGGSAVGFVPGVGDLRLDPDLVLVFFLPPLLFNAAYFTSTRDLRADARTIGLNACGLVLLTTGLVAIVVHAAVSGLPWAAAFAFGAVVSPTDPLAASEIGGRLGLSQRTIAVIEGESLINDGTALVVYRTAVAAATGAAFDAMHAVGDFVLSIVGGVAIGVVVATIMTWVFRRVGQDEALRVTISLAAGYLAYLPADAGGVSGVLAAVTAGLIIGRRAPGISTSGSRLHGYAFWTVLVFVLNAALFTLVGLGLPAILHDQQRPAGELVLFGVGISVTVILVRLVWLNTVPYVIRAVDRRPAQRDRRIGWRLRLINGWSGMRGAVSLAAALALPDDLPDRDLFVFLTLCVIWATLVGQGLTLPWLIRTLGIENDGVSATEELRARKAATRAAMDELDRLGAESWTRDDTVDRMRGAYAFRARRLAQRAGHQENEDEDVEARSRDYQRMVRRVLEAQRRAVVALRDDGTVSDRALQILQRELDLEEERLDL